MRDLFGQLAQGVALENFPTAGRENVVRPFSWSAC